MGYFFQETHFEVVYFLTFWKKLKPWTFEEANLIRRNIGMFDLPCTLKNLRTVWKKYDHFLRTAPICFWLEKDIAWKDAKTARNSHFWYFDNLIFWFWPKTDWPLPWHYHDQYRNKPWAIKNYIVLLAVSGSIKKF